MSTEISINSPDNLSAFKKRISDHINNMASNKLFDNHIDESVFIKYTEDFIINDDFISLFRNQLITKLSDESIQNLIGKRLGDVAIIKTEIVHDEFRLSIEFK
jgi:hypothetical protein